MQLTFDSRDRDFDLAAAKESTLDHFDNPIVSDVVRDNYPIFSVSVNEIYSKNLTPITSTRLSLTQQIQELESALAKLRLAQKAEASHSNTTHTSRNSSARFSTDSGFGSDVSLSTAKPASLDELTWDELASHDMHTTLSAADLDLAYEDASKGAISCWGRHPIQRERLSSTAFGPVSVHYPGSSNSCGETKFYETSSEAIAAIRKAKIGQFDNYCKFDQRIRVIFLFARGEFMTDLLNDTKLGIETLYLPPGSTVAYRIVPRGVSVTHQEAKLLHNIFALTQESSSQPERLPGQRVCPERIGDFRVIHYDRADNGDAEPAAVLSDEEYENVRPSPSPSQYSEVGFTAGKSASTSVLDIQIPFRQPRGPPEASHRPLDSQSNLSEASCISLASGFQFSKFADELAQIAGNGFASKPAKSFDSFPAMSLDILDDSGSDAAATSRSATKSSEKKAVSTPLNTGSRRSLVHLLHSRGLMPQPSPGLRGSASAALSLPLKRTSDPNSKQKDDMKRPASEFNIVPQKVPRWFTHSPKPSSRRVKGHSRKALADDQKCL